MNNHAQSIPAGWPFSVKKGVLICLLLLHGFCSFAQFPNPTLFNTGTNAAGTGTLPVFSQDLNWQASITSSLGPWSNAAVCGNATGAIWSNSPYSNATWISFPHTCSGSSPAEHSCISGMLDIYYKLQINLPAQTCGQSISTPSAYCLSLDFIADNCVSAIWLNGTLSYTTPVPPGNSQYYYSGFYLSNKVTATLCNNWVSGVNTILVLVRSGSNPSPTWEAFLAQANQTVNPNVGNPLSANVNVTNPACIGSTGSATVSAAGALGNYTYSWVPTGGTSTVASSLAPGNYSCIVTSSNLCSVTRTFAVVTQLQGTLSISPASTSVCIGSPLSFTASQVGGVGPYTYSWTGGPQTAVYTSTPATAGVSIYTVTSSNAGNCIATMTAMASIVPQPTLSVGSQSACPGSTVVLQATGAAAYTWQPGNQAGPNLTLTPGSSAVYTVTGSGGGCSAQTTASVYVPPPLSLALVSSSAACFNGTGSATVSASGAFGNYSYTWSPVGGTSNIASGLPAGTYSCTVTSSGQCAQVVTVSIQQPQQGTLSLTASSPSICLGSSATFTAVQSGGTGPYTYSWSAGTASPVLVATPSLSGLMSYTAIVTDARNCVLQQSIGVQVISNPVVVVNSPSVCPGNSATLTANGATSYTWSPGNIQGASQVVVPANTSTYIVTGSSGGCQASVTATVFVAPALTLSLTASSASLCVGNSATITPASGGGIQPHAYQLLPLSGPASSFVVTPPTQATNTYSVRVTDAIGCTLTQTISITSYFAVQISVPNLSICPGTSSVLTASGAATYTWMPGLLQGAAQLIPAPGPLTYTVSGTSVSGCSASAVASVFVYVAPTLSLNTFSITCGSLGQATVMAMGGGPYNYTWLPTGQTSSAAGGFFPGTYTVLVHDISISCIFSPTTSFLPLVPMTGTLTNSNFNLCPGVGTGSASIALSGGSGAQTYLWSGNNYSQSTATVSNLPAGVNTISVTDALTFCNVTQTFVINEPPAFTVLATPSSPSVCLGEDIVLTGQSTGATAPYSYTWQNGNAAPVYTVNETSAGFYTYTLNVQDANQCSASRTITVRFVPHPTLTAVSQTICPLKTATLTAGGAGTYTWSSGTQGSNFSASPPVTTIYTVTGTSQACTGSTTAMIFLLPEPVPVLLTNAPVCQNELLTFSVTGGNTYTWNGPHSFTSQASTFSFASAQPSLSGLYQVTLTAINTCTSLATASVAVNALPVLFAGGSTVCAGSPLVLSSNFIAGASYTWSNGSFTATGQNVSVPPQQAASGIYTLAVTNNKGCVNQATVSTSLAPPITVSITGITGVCAGRTLQLSATPVNNFTWYGPTGYLNTGMGMTINHIPATAQGLYSVVSTAGPCTATAAVQVSVFPLPYLVTSSPSLACQNTALSFSASGAVTYTWSGPQSYQQSGNPIVINPAGIQHAGVYTVTGTDLNLCVSTKTLAVAILPAPFISAPDVSVCAGGDAVLTAVAAPATSTLQWISPTAPPSTGTAVVVYSVVPAQAGVYTVIATGANGCAGIRTLFLSVRNNTLPLISVSGHTNICMDGKLSLQAGGARTYTWTGPSYSTIATGLQLPALPAHSGIYTVSAQNDSGCVASRTLEVILHGLPVVRLKSNLDLICAPACVELSAVRVDSRAGLEMTMVTALGSNISRSGNAHCFNKAGKYLFSVVSRDSFGCVGTNTLGLDVWEKPNADFSFSPKNPVAGLDLVHLYNQSIGAGQSSWHWLPQSADSTWPSGENVTHVFENTGTYPVVLLVTNAAGCADTIIKQIVVEDEFGLFVPNTFTPDGDGLNDVFGPKGTGLKKYSLRIFDRWGQQIFYSAAFEKGWDGTKLNSPCQQDEYVWLIEGLKTDGTKFSRTGHVLLLR